VLRQQELDYCTSAKARDAMAKNVTHYVRRLSHWLTNIVCDHFIVSYAIVSGGGSAFGTGSSEQVHG